MMLRPIRPGSITFTVFLGLLAALPPLSIDITIPTFLAAEADLQSSPGTFGQTVTLFMIGFAVGQFGAGPISDRRGRRPVLLCGLSLYCVAAAGCALSDSVSTLIALRFAQGIAAGICAVLAFAIIRDLFEGDSARVKRSYVTVILSLAPMLAPTLGAGLLSLAGWRSIFVVLCATGLLLLVACLAGIVESRPALPPGEVRHPSRIYIALFRDPHFAALTIVNALSYGVIFAYIAGSSTVIMGVFGQPIAVYAGFFACTAASLTAGAWVSGRCAKMGISPEALVSSGLFTAATSAAALSALLLAGRGCPLMLAPLVLVNLFARGLIAPNAQHLALEPIRRDAGTAAAAVGVTQILTGAAASAAVTLLLPGFGPLAMSLVMTILGTTALLLWLSSRHMAPRLR